MRILSLWLVAASLATATTAFAQRGVVTRANVKALDRIAVSAERDYKASRSKALALAKKNGWAIEKTFSDGSHISLQGLDSKGMPIYYITYNNSRAAATTSTDAVWAGGELGLSLSGAHPAVREKMAIWDGGRVRETHQELKERIVQKDNPNASSEHATHVAGTMIAKGINPLAKGMAHGITKLLAYDFNGDLPEIAEAAKDLLVSNHSYGTISGWRFNSDRKGTAEDPYWEWWGDTDISSTEDYKFGYYNSTASSWDQIAFNAPYYLIVKSAGNDRTMVGPQVGQPYYQRNSNGNFTKIDARPTGISSNNGYDIISTYGTAKNILTVGAVNPISEGYQDSTDVVISSFSSFGPTDDGRIKPDIVGNGVSVLSSSDKSNNAYTSLSGTSMAAPNVSGSLILLQEHYANLKNGNVMRAATLKGLVLHTADEAGSKAGPDYIYGWGLMNTKRAASVISNTSGTHLMQENSLSQGETFTHKVVASGKGPLVVTISWTDPEASPIPLTSSALNNRTPRLVNDLDVRVLSSTSTFMPWVLNPETPAAAATKGDNKVDNVEQVEIKNAVPGETYTISVNHKGTLVRGPQAYSLIVSGAGGTEFCESKPSSDAGAKITSFTLGSHIQNFNNTCTTYQDLTNNVLAFEMGQAKQLRLGLGSCSGDAAKVAKVFIDWNGNGNFDDAGEMVAASEVINGNGTFETSIKAPVTVEVGDKVRMRLVVHETTDAASVTACGTFSRGETQDYVIQFARPQTDIAVTAVSLAGPSMCANPAQPVLVNIQNVGSAEQANIPIAISVRKNGTEVKQLTATYTGTLKPFGRAELLLPETFATEAGATYELVALANAQNDVVENNNRKITAFTVGSPAESPVDAAAFRCGNDPNYTLSATGQGGLYWFNSPTNTQPIAAGNQILVPVSQVGSKLYAAFNTFEGTIGAPNKDFASGGGYNTFSPDVLVKTNAPVLLESARLYIGNSGKITFTVFDDQGAPVSAKSLNVTATRTTPAPGAQLYDPNDPGAIYYLGLELPAVGTYRIAISYENGATIFRNNAGVTGYPFNSSNVVSIVGNTASTTPESYYYYFYNMKVRALGCPSPRVEAIVKGGTPLTQPIITRDLKTLVSSAPEGNQWYKDKKAIPGATGKVYTPKESGNYSVQVFKDGCVSEVSLAYTFAYNPDIRELGSAPVISPNPSTGRVRVEVETKQPEDIEFDVTDMLGNHILSRKVEKHNGQYEGYINLTAYASGLYILRVRHGDKVYSEKILIQH